MPDLWNFSATRSGNANLTVPTWAISGKVVNRGGGLAELDFSGANALSFPQLLGQLTAAQQDNWVEFVVHDLVRRRLNF